MYAVFTKRAFPLLNMPCLINYMVFRKLCAYLTAAPSPCVHIPVSLLNSKRQKQVIVLNMRFDVGQDVASIIT